MLFHLLPPRWNLESELSSIEKGDTTPFNGETSVFTRQLEVVFFGPDLGICGIERSAKGTSSVIYIYIEEEERGGGEISSAKFSAKTGYLGEVHIPIAHTAL